MDSAQAYKAQEARSQSLPPDTKSPAEMLTVAGAQQQNVSSIYLATESAPASPFGSLQSAVSRMPAAGGLLQGMTAGFCNLPLMPSSAHDNAGCVGCMCFPHAPAACVHVLCLTAAETKPAAAGHQEAPGVCRGHDL